MRVRLATPAGAVLLSCLLRVLAGPEHLTAWYHTGIARLRPRTPACPAITAAFSAAFPNIARGGGVRRTPGPAAGRIDRNLAAHRCYQPSEP